MSKPIDRLTPQGKQFERMLKELTSKEVHVGFQRGDAQDENGVDMCDIAMWNELGTVRSPARPFMRQSVDNHLDEINREFQALKADILRGRSAEQILKELGVFQKDLMQNEIITGDFVPNAPSTIRRKGSSKPLIDTGRMRQSVDYVIKPKGEREG